MALFVFILAGCNTSTLDADQSACAELTCTAGTCEVHGGEPRCTCSAFEQAALGRECEAAPMQQRETSDEGNSPETAILLQPSEQGLEATITLSPDFGRDVDHYVLAHQPGHYYEVWCETRREPGWLAACDLRLEDEGHMDLRRPYPDTRPGVWEFKARETTRMHLSVGAGWNVKGKYLLHARDLGLDVHGDSYETATPLGETGVLDGRLESRHDVDHFAMEVVKDHAYYVSLSAELGLGISGETLREYAFFAETTGLHRIVVGSEKGAPQNYQLRFEARGPDDHTSWQGTPLVPGAPSLVGRLETATDKDVFSFTPPSNDHFYRLRCMLSTGKRCDLAVYPVEVSPTLQQPADGWVFQGWVFDSWEEQVIRLTVSASAAPVGATYTLSLEDLGVDDFPEYVWAPITPGITRGVFELAGDSDLFAPQGRSGRLYRVHCDCTLFAQHTTSGGPWYELKPYYDGDPIWLSFGSEPGEPALKATRATTGAYSLTIEEEPWTDDYMGETALPLATPLSGVLEYKHDQDRFTLELSAGTTYVVELVGQSNLAAFLQWPALAPSRTFMGPGTYAFTADVGGTYHLSLYQNINAGEAPPSAYQLTVR